MIIPTFLCSECMTSIAEHIIVHIDFDKTNDVDYLQERSSVLRADVSGLLNIYQEIFYC